MDKKSIILGFVMLMLLSTCLQFEIPILLGVQPPIDNYSYYMGTIGQPRRVDPARAYDAASGELIMNVYEPLIFFSDKPLMPDTTAGVTEDKIADLSKFEPLLAVSMPTISDDGLTWTFTIRDGVKFHPWRKADGTVVTDQILTAEDVEYSFKRMLVQDQTGSPQWMIAEPLTGYQYFDSLDAVGSTNTIEPQENEDLVAYLINNAITRSDNNLTFHLAEPIPETPFMQILAQTWSCIVNKEFCIEHGCWNGTFYLGWSTDYRRKPSNSYSPLDIYYAAKSKFTTDTTPVMCGTGPYKFTSWDKANKVWRIDKFDNYWKGWAGSHLNTVISKGIDAWPTRKMLFLEGEFDVLAGPRANMWDLLDRSDAAGHTPISGITLYYNAPALSNEVMLFNFQVAADSPFMSTVPGSSPAPDLFANVHMRRAFAHSLNFTAYIEDAWFNEAIQPTTWWVKGLAPDYEDHTLVPPNIDTAAIEAELKQVFVPAISNTSSVWDLGFETYLVYNLGNDQRKIACDMIAQSFATLGSKYKVNVIGIDWPTYLEYEEEMFMPVFFVGWLADLADADNFARPYMHTYGDFWYFQNVQYGQSARPQIFPYGDPTKVIDNDYVTLLVDSGVGRFLPMSCKFEGGFPTPPPFAFGFGVQSERDTINRIVVANGWGTNAKTIELIPWPGSKLLGGLFTEWDNGPLQEEDFAGPTSFWIFYDTGFVEIFNATRAGTRFKAPVGIDKIKLAAKPFDPDPGRHKIELAMWDEKNFHNMSVTGQPRNDVPQGKLEQPLKQKRTQPAEQTISGFPERNLDANDFPLTVEIWTAKDPKTNRQYRHVWKVYQNGTCEYISTADPFSDGMIGEVTETEEDLVRQEIYQELQAIYVDEVPSLPLAQPLVRRWQRDWVRGWYYNQLYPGLYAYDLYKATGTLESVDLDVSHTITPTTAQYPVVYFYKYAMKIGNGDPNPALMTYSISVKRSDSNTNIGLLYAVVGLKRQNKTGPLPPRDPATSPPTAALPVEYPNATYVVLPPGGTATLSLNWYEDGTTQKIVQSVWQVGAETYPVTSNANDTNRANNYIADGTVDVRGPLVADINRIRVGGVVVTTGDGVVDVLDAITLAGTYGKKAGETGYNADANLKTGDTAPEEINIFDALLLATNFGKHIP